MLRTCCIADWKPEEEQLRLSLLPEEERARLAKIQHDTVRRLHLAAHAMAREAPAPLVGVPPRQVPICLTENGKPDLPDRDLYFSLAHAGDTAFCVVDRFPVGVDAERRSRFVSPALKRRACSAEELAWLESLPEEEWAAGFLRLWTLKEAYIKAVGGVLSDAWGVSFSPEGEGWKCSEPGFVCRTADTGEYVVSLVWDMRSMCCE